MWPWLLRGVKQWRDRGIVTSFYRSLLFFWHHSENWVFLKTVSFHFQCIKLPWSQRLSFNIIFFHLEISGARRWSKRRVGRKRKPLVATVENLTFMLAQHLTAVEDVIFFWPITKGDLIYNLLTGPGGSVLRYSEINLLRREKKEAFAVFTSCQRNFQGLVFIPERDKFLFWHLKWKGKT